MVLVGKGLVERDGGLCWKIGGGPGTQKLALPSWISGRTQWVEILGCRDCGFPTHFFTPVLGL